MDRPNTAKIGDKIERFWRLHKDDIYLILAIFLLSMASFGLGRLSVGLENKDQFEIIYPDGQEASASVAIGEKNYVASISGTKYHLPWCSGAKTIKEENKIWFETKEDAELAGYTPAQNCEGI